MKGQILSLTRTTIIVIVILAFFVGALFFATQWGLGTMLSGSCGNGIQEPGETKFLCPQDWAEDEIIFTAEHLEILSGDDSWLLSNLRSEYLNYPPIGEKEDCTSCGNPSHVCTGCYDSQEYKDGTGCSDCSGCNEITGECSSCFKCDEAHSDYSKDEATYSNCQTCLDCTTCAVEEGSSYSENCNSCTYCKLCDTPTESTKTYDFCDYCSYNLDGTAATGCLACYNNNFNSDEKYFNLCEECEASSCASCENSEPYLCQNVKECIASYLPDNPQPCVIDYHLSVRDATKDTDIYNDIIKTLKRCKNNDPIYGSVSDSGKQFICNFYYNPSDVKSSLTLSNRQDASESPGETWQGDRDATYVQCGAAGYPLNRLYYNSWAFGNPPGMNYRIAIGDINSGMYDIPGSLSGSGFDIAKDGNCRFNMFLCAQPALITTTRATEADDYAENPLTKIYSSVISMDKDKFEYFKEAPYEAVKSAEIEIDLGTHTANINDIADATISAVRDWVAISENDISTIDKINNIITTDGNIDAFGDTTARKLKMNDRFASAGATSSSPAAMPKPLNWEMIAIDSSLRDNTYGNDDKLFYVYSYDTIQTPSTIPAVHEFPAISRNPIEGSWALLNNSVAAYAAESYLEWSYVGDCDTKTWLYALKDATYTYAVITDKTKKNQILDNDGLDNFPEKFDYKKYMQPNANGEFYWLAAENKIQIKNEYCQIANSKIYYKYSLGAAGDKKYVFYETNDPVNNINPQYTGKIKVQVAFYIESEKKRLDDDPYVMIHTFPADYVDNTLVLTPMISIAQVD